MRACRLAILLLMLDPFALAHVGSPNVYFEGAAGPYELLVTVNPPAMVPGIAQVEIRVTSGTVSSISVAPVYVNGKDQGLPPTADSLQPSAADPQWFTGKVWMMESGSWEVRVEVAGTQGTGKLAIPVPVFARSTLPMESPFTGRLTARPIACCALCAQRKITARSKWGSPMPGMATSRRPERKTSSDSAMPP